MKKESVKKEKYEILQQTHLDELQATLTLLKHKESGAQIVHIGNQDKENCFAISLRTYPSSSDGAAHILEHVALCGSKKYPVKDPFFEMTRRSLSTFMNAFTSPDYTCYPAATQNEKDFYNLLSVYLDAVFFPTLSKESFLQEGHRLAFDKLDDPTTRLKRQGVVYNEMKGEASCPDTRLNQHLMEALFPDLPYRFNSGGDPKEIPNLSYKGLKEFHQKFYNPSRSLFYFYGNIPLEKHLEFLEQSLFKNQEPLPPLPQLELQPRRDKPVDLKYYYPVAQNEEEGQKATFAFGWLTAPSTELVEATALEILDILLNATDGSPLTEAVLQTGLCKQVESLIDMEMSEIPYQIVCRGCREGAKEALFNCIESTLKEVVDRGFTSEQIEGALHQVELERLEISHSGQPYGLSLFFKVAAQLQHGGDAIEALSVHSLFEKLREKLKNPKYLSSLIEKHFLKNTHRVDITLLPSKQMGAQEEKDEREQLESLKKNLTDAQKYSIVQDSLHLYQLQEREEDPDVLPKIRPEDLSPNERDYPLTKIEGALPIYHHECVTNGLLYANLVYPIPDLSLEELPYLRLLSLFFPQVGRGKKNYKEHLEEMVNVTGGIRCWVDTNCQAENPGVMSPTFSIRGKALERNVPALFNMIKELITSCRLQDKKRLEELLFQHLEFVDTSLHSSPLRYATNLAASSLTTQGFLNEQTYGLHYYKNLQKIVQKFAEDPDTLIVPLTKLYEKILRVDSPDLVLSCSEEATKQIIEADYHGLAELPSAPRMPWKGEYALPEMHSQGRLISSRVGFTVQLFPSIAYNHPDSASLSLAAEIMTSTTLHKKVREQGGAYGSEAIHMQPFGFFYLYSYRDPNLKKTLAAFQEGILKIAQGKFTKRHIEEAKCSLFQQLDAPLSPGGRAESTYLLHKSGQTLEARQAYRTAVLTADASSIKAAVQSHLLPNLDSGYSVTFGSQEYFEEENPLLTPPLPLYPV
jgi:presequence protease